MSRLLNKLQRINRAVHYRLGIDQALYKSSAARDTIVMYHNVLPTVRTDINIRNISVDDFAKQLRYFKKRFAIVPLCEMFNSSSNSKRIALTFDDGLINNLRYALSVIEEEKVPVTFFITASWLRGQSTLWPDLLSILLSNEQKSIAFNKEIFVRTSPIHFRSEVTNQLLQQALIASDPKLVEQFISILKLRLNIETHQQAALNDLSLVMNGDEIKLLSQSLWVEIGSHCITHHNLVQLNDEQILEELMGSKNYLEKVIGKEVKSIAYPFGSYSKQILDVAEKLGYTRQLAVNYLFEDDKYDLRIRNRIGLYSDRSCIEQLHLVNEFARGLV